HKRSAAARRRREPPRFSSLRAKFSLSNPPPAAKIFRSRCMQIGPHSLRNNLFVAPMAGVTDRPFRQLCKKFGAGLAVSEMVASNSLLWGSEKTRRRANHDGEVEPISGRVAAP